MKKKLTKDGQFDEASRKLCRNIGGPLATHNRWHRDRGKFNWKCVHCITLRERLF